MDLADAIIGTVFTIIVLGMYLKIDSERSRRVRMEWELEWMQDEIVYSDDRIKSLESYTDQLKERLQEANEHEVDLIEKLDLIDGLVKDE